MKKRFIFFIIFIVNNLIFAQSIKGQCLVDNISFQAGESITYHAYYNWGFIWLNAGVVNFSTKKDNYKGKDIFKITAVGRTLDNYDWIYAIRDTFITYVDGEGLFPYYFHRNTLEGSYKVDEKYTYDYENKNIYSELTTSKKPLHNDTLTIDRCVWDVLSLVYYVRNINFDGLKIGEKKYFNVVIDNEINSIYVRYLGIEDIKNKDDVVYKCYKFSPLLVEGTIFEKGEDMTVWVTANQNRVPVLVEAKILVGSVKAVLVETKGLRK